MVIIGTGGMAKDIVGSLARDYRHKVFYFYNDRSDYAEKLFVNRYPIIRNIGQLQKHFTQHGYDFVSAIANPLLRMRMNDKIREIGGNLTTVIAMKENVSEFTEIEAGTIIQPDIVISSEVFVGEGCFFNCGTIIGHDVRIGKYTSFGPGVRVLGNAEIGEFSYIGCNAIIAPGVKIGKKVRIGMAKVITEDVPDGSKIV
ncbi:MAG: acetyltransferase [Bacteroidetes bacterium]|nr:acetyltransferase [Bacteroidota bacterium]MCB9225554.1 acetyltransferase [Chitinophagales bacterium]